MDKDNLEFICMTLRDDADLFGSRLGGARACPGSKNLHCANGKLFSVLLPSQQHRTVIILDEFQNWKNSDVTLDEIKPRKCIKLEPWQNGNHGKMEV